MDGNYTAIKGKLYPNSLVVESFKDDLWLIVCENIDTCWSIFAIISALVVWKIRGQYCLAF